MKNKKENIKKFWNKLKEIWKDPRKKAGIKLLGYFIFFLIFLSIAAISNGLKKIDNTVSNDNNQIKENSKNEDTNKFIDKQNKLLYNKHNVNMVIKINNIEYKINGTLRDNIIEGYLETDNGIKKIIVKNNNMYEIVDSNDVLLESVINVNLFDFDNLFNNLKNNNALIKNKNNNKDYIYQINDNGRILNVKIYTNENSIYKVEYLIDSDEYVIDFDK